MFHSKRSSSTCGPLYFFTSSLHMLQTPYKNSPFCPALYSSLCCPSKAVAILVSTTNLLYEACCLLRLLWHSLALDCQDPLYHENLSNYQLGNKCSSTRAWGHISHPEHHSYQILSAKEQKGERHQLTVFTAVWVSSV